MSIHGGQFAPPASAVPAHDPTQSWLWVLRFQQSGWEKLHVSHPFDKLNDMLFLVMCSIYVCVLTGIGVLNCHNSGAEIVPAGMTTEGKQLVLRLFHP